MKGLRLIVFILVVGAIAGLYFSGLGDYLSLDYLRGQWSAITAYIAEHPLQSGAIYFLLYVLVAAASLPAAALITVLGGALFGLAFAMLLVSFASSIGALLAFLVARFILRDGVQSRFGERLKPVNRGFEKDGAFYLLSLRLVPIFPFWFVNIVMSLTPVRAPTFYWVSQLGMLPGTFVFVNAGAQVAGIETLSLDGIMTPGIIGSLVLLGLMPLLLKALLGALSRRRKLRAFKKPKHFDANMLVVGAGSAGLVASIIGATLKAKTILVESGRMGGDCLNTGCVPSKTLLASAATAQTMRRAGDYGIEAVEPRVDFPRVMQRVREVIRRIEPKDSVERYTGLGVECVQGRAQFVSPWEVEVGGRRISARRLVLASGGGPLVPPIPGLESLDYLTSDNLWELTELPGRLVVLGGGPIGCELSQAFARLGSQVTVVEMEPRLMPREDAEVGELMAEVFTAEGIRVLAGHRATRFTRGQVVLEGPEGELEVEFDQVLLALGRRANAGDMGLEALGVEFNPNGTVAVDDYLCTTCPTLYACGDVVGPWQFTHIASHQAWHAAVNALFSGIWRVKVNYQVIPWATFTSPEVARVGLSEDEAKAQDIAHEVTVFPLGESDRALADGADKGWVKVLTRPGKDRILGACIVGSRASDMIVEFITAMKQKQGLGAIMAAIHIYPTLSEANKFVASEWRKARAPQGLLRWVERLHALRR